MQTPFEDQSQVKVKFNLLNIIKQTLQIKS